MGLSTFTLEEQRRRSLGMGWWLLLLAEAEAADGDVGMRGRRPLLEAREKRRGGRSRLGPVGSF